MAVVENEHSPYSLPYYRYVHNHDGCSLRLCSRRPSCTATSDYTLKAIHGRQATLSHRRALLDTRRHSTHAFDGPSRDLLICPLFDGATRDCASCYWCNTVSVRSIPESQGEPRGVQTFLRPCNNGHAMVPSRLQRRSTQDTLTATV